MQLQPDCRRQLLSGKWFIDEIYEAVVIAPIGKLSQWLWKVFDVRFIDQIVLSFGRLSNWGGETARQVQTGSIQAYAFVLMFGILLTVGYLFYGLR